MKDREKIEFAAKPKVETGVSTKEDAPADSPLTKATNPHKAILLPENSFVTDLGKRLKLNILFSIVIYIMKVR